MSSAMKTLAWPLQLTANAEKRLRELIYCKARGLSVREIAEAMGTTVQTVKNYSRELRDHFGAATTIEAVLIARREWNLEL